MVNVSFFEMLRRRHIDVTRAIATRGASERCIIYINPFNYFALRCSGVNFGQVFYRVDGFFARSIISALFKPAAPLLRQSFDMTSLAPEVLTSCERSGWKVFFAGGSAEHIEKFVSKIRVRFPRLLVCGYCDGYETEETIIEKVKAARPDVVVLGLGNIKQEYVAIRAFEQYRALYFTCGAFISQTAKSSGLDYYPWIFNKTNTRFIYRMFVERHVIKRVLMFYPRFLFRAFLDASQMKSM